MTLQQALTRGLTIGMHEKVELVRNGVAIRCAVWIPNRGRPLVYLAERRTSYGHWPTYRVDGETLDPKGSIWKSDEAQAAWDALPPEASITV